jgi:cytochrome c peroxidase
MQEYRIFGQKILYSPHFLQQSIFYIQKKQEENVKKYIFITAIGAVLLFLIGLIAAPPASAELKPIIPDLTGIVKDKNWALVLGKALFHDMQAGSKGQACYSCHFVAGADTRIKNALSPGFNDVTFGPLGDATFGSVRSDTVAVAPGYMPSGAKADSNYTLKAADFPLNRLADELDRNSAVVSTTNDRVSSSGSFDSDYERIFRFFWLTDICEQPSNAIFHAGKYAARQVEPRNTPTTINAALNHRNFWDGRANNMFNGVGPFGMRDILGDPKNRLIVLNNGKPELGWLQLENASTASQAVGPPLSAKEMSCDGRKFADVGRKLLLRQPLEVQKVAATDSILGPYRNKVGLGLGLDRKYTYATLIKNAFDPKWWSAPGKYTIDTSGSAPKLKPDLLKGYTQMETNFSMFWGISIMLYEATLISDQSEFDTLVANGDLVIVPLFGCIAPKNNVDPLLLHGCNLVNNLNPNLSPIFGFPIPPVQRPDSLGGGFVNAGSCSICHTMTPTNSTFTEVAQTVDVPFAPTAIVFPNAAFLTALSQGGVPNPRDIDGRDFGFANLGIRPVVEDLGLGGADPYGNPLSYLSQIKDGKIIDSWLTKDVIDSITVNPPLGGPFIPGPSGTKLENYGAFKVPTWRNIALTPPYFMAGHYSDLRQMLAVYNRGGNRREIANDPGKEAHGSTCITGDTSGTGPDGNQTWPVQDLDCATNAAFSMVRLGWKDCENSTEQPCDVNTDDIAAVVRFLKSLTDVRVQCDQAPFDHPSLLVFNGHLATDLNRDGKADDILFNLPAVGAEGYARSSGFCIPNSGDLFAPGMQARSGGQRVPLNE